MDEFPALANGAASTFTIFDKLPEELRLLIWEAALPRPRIVPLTIWPLEKLRSKMEQESGVSTCAYAGSCLDESEGNDGMFTHVKAQAHEELVGCRSTLPPPAMLFVCRESFNVASAHYVQAFAPSLGTPVPEMYFDFERDTLYLCCRNFALKQDAPNYSLRHHNLLAGEIRLLGDTADFKRVRNLAIRVSDNLSSALPDLSGVFSGVLRTFTGLKSLTLVHITRGPDMSSLVPYDNDSATSFDRRTYYEDEQIFLMDAIDVSGTLAIYRDFVQLSMSEQRNLKVPDPKPYTPTIIQPSIEALQRQFIQLNSLFDYIEESFSSPEFDFALDRDFLI